MATSYNIGFLPKIDVRIPFQKIWANSDAEANAMAGKIQSLRKAGTGYSVTKNLRHTGDTTPPDQGAFYYRLCFKFTTPSGVIVTICLEHADLNVNVFTIANLLQANCTSESGETFDKLITIHATSVTYV